MDFLTRSNNTRYYLLGIKKISLQIEFNLIIIEHIILKCSFAKGLILFRDNALSFFDLLAMIILPNYEWYHTLISCASYHSGFKSKKREAAQFTNFKKTRWFYPCNQLYCYTIFKLVSAHPNNLSMWSKLTIFGCSPAKYFKGGEKISNTRVLNAK